MKKKILLILFLIIFIVFFTINKKHNLTNDVGYKVENINQISKVYFADRYNNELTLTKSNEKNQWLVNNKYPVRENTLDMFFETISKMEIKHPVSKNMHNTVVKSLATNGVKVEIYDKKLNNIKTFYVGEETPDYLGTYMLIENNKIAHVVHIPGFNGFLAPRFNINNRSVSSELWRSRKIFFDNIDTISIYHYENKEKSFTLDLKNCTLYKKNLEEIKEIPEKIIFDYHKLLKNLNCEGFTNNLRTKDSIINSTPLYVINVIYSNKNKKKLKLFRKKPKRKKYQDDKGKFLEYDVDRLFAYDEEDLFLIQNYVFNPILNPIFNVKN